MRVRLLFLCASVLWLCGCLLASPRAAQLTRPGAETTPSASPTTHNLMLFSHSENCVACHNNLSTPAGEDVSIGASWRSTMMANSGRDPYWQASVRRETMDHRRHSAAIQDECAGCHMPMSTQVARASGGSGEVFAYRQSAGPETPLSRLAADGVSCTVCHQIDSQRLGTPDSYNGGFVLAPTPASGRRVIFGRHRVDTGRKTIMHSVTGFEQAEGAHIGQSELCATCHTLITNAFDENGQVVGSLPEQMNYQEWRHSDFPREQRSCQSCHMPAAAGPVRVASVLGDNRDRVSRHLFVGGNAFMLRLFNRYRTELGVEALPAELEATAVATIRQLREQTATVTVSVPRLSAGDLEFDVDVRNLTGHKYPTGYPARRTWLHVTVHDAGGTVVFESGAVAASGAISGNDADDDPNRFEPHYQLITRADQVQIYEPILSDPAGRPTTGLLTATQYLKDNRLLPRGFDKATADAQIAVHGDAAVDADFDGGGDRVRYRVPVPASGGPFAVDVELRYQPIGYRWARNLERYDAPEPRRFVGYYDALAPSSSVVVASATGHQASER